MRRIVCLLLLATAVPAAPAAAQLRSLTRPHELAEVAVSPHGYAIATWPGEANRWQFARRRPGGGWSAPAPLPDGIDHPEVRIGPRGDAALVSSFTDDDTRTGTPGCCLSFQVAVLPWGRGPLPLRRPAPAGSTVEFHSAEVDGRGRVTVRWESWRDGRHHQATTDAGGRFGPRRLMRRPGAAYRAVARFLKVLRRELRWDPIEGPPAAVGPNGRGYVVRGTRRRVTLLRCRRGCVRVDTALRRRGRWHWVFGSRDVNGEALVTG